MFSLDKESWCARQLGLIVDLLSLILDWRLAARIRKFSMPLPGDILVVSDRIIVDRLIRNSYPYLKGPVPILLCDNVDNIQSVDFKTLTEVYNRAYAAKLALDQGVAQRENGQLEADGREKRRQESLAN